MTDKVIVFDLGKVIFDYDVNIISKKLSEYSTEKKLFENMDAFMFSNKNLFMKYEKGQISSVDFYNKLIELASLKNLSFKKFTDIWNDIFTPIDDVVELINSLSKKYELAILSNTNDLHFDYLYKKYSNFFTNFKKLHLSYLMNSRKPDTDIYLQVIKYHNLKPENIFFTDDNQRNIDVAREIGIKAYNFENITKLKQDLKDFGIEV